MSKICVLTGVEAEKHRETGQLPDCRGHRHVSRVAAVRHIEAGEAIWGSESSIVMNDPWRLVHRRSGRDGPVVMQLVRDSSIR